MPDWLPTYGYDELSCVTECNFREMPETGDPDREMSADPWFGVGDNDIPPEEFRNFLGIRGERRHVLEQHYADLLECASGVVSGTGSAPAK